VAALSGPSARHWADKEGRNSAESALFDLAAGQQQSDREPVDPAPDPRLALFADAQRARDAYIEAIRTWAVRQRRSP
jgi:hypothetical protein